MHAFWQSLEKSCKNLSTPKAIREKVKMKISNPKNVQVVEAQVNNIPTPRPPPLWGS